MIGDAAHDFGKNPLADWAILQFLQPAQSVFHIDPNPRTHDGFEHPALAVLSGDPSRVVSRALGIRPAPLAYDIIQRGVSRFTGWKFFGPIQCGFWIVRR